MMVTENYNFYGPYASVTIMRKGV
ncbi:MAG: hypothetical protein K0R47_621, partial [Brevibacillus sp.]|nr:hypothetical protein [Brevibacillus sp.]